MHKHAEFFTDILEGGDPFSWEAKAVWESYYGPITEYVDELLLNPEAFEVRRVKQTFELNGYQVPYPIKTEPEIGKSYWVVDFYGVYGITWNATDKYFTRQAQLYLDKQDAEIFLEALLSVGSL